MKVENFSYKTMTASQSVKQGRVVDAEDIKTILFLGIRSDIPASESKRKVDIII